MTHSRSFSGLWIAPVVMAMSLVAASTDVRLVEAVKNSESLLQRDYDFSILLHAGHG